MVRVRDGWGRYLLEVVWGEMIKRDGESGGQVEHAAALVILAMWGGLGFMS